jgi:hypothetical protein
MPTPADRVVVAAHPEIAVRLAAADELDDDAGRCISLG